jgi:hypothetical protein
MPIITPHQSQVGIAVANPGQAANYQGVSSFVTPGQAAMPAALNQLAAGIDKAGNAVFEAGLERKKANITAEFLERELIEKEEARTNWDSLQKNHQGKDALEIVEMQKAYLDGRLEGLKKDYGGNPFLMNMAGKMFAPINESYINKAVEYRDQQERVYQQAVSNKASEEALRIHSDLKSTDDDLRNSLLSFRLSLRTLYGGNIEAVDAAYMKALPQLHVERAESFIVNNRFEEARRYIQNNAKGFGGNANNLNLMIEKKIDAHLNRMITLENRELKRIRDEAEKELYEFAFDNKLTREDVEKHRDILTPDDYHKFLKFTRGEYRLPEKSNPEAIIRLTRMAVRGDQGTADSMLRSGELTIGDYRTAINEGQQFRDPVVKEVMRDIERLTGTSELNPPAGARESFVNAKRDYLDWLDSDAGRKASDKERLEMGCTIAKHYRIVNTEETLFTMPLPLNLVGTKTNPYIKATAKRIEAQYKAGRLNDAQRNEELVRLKRISDLVDEQERENAENEAARKGGRRR